MKIRSGAHARGRKGGGAAADTACSAAGFLAGVACALLLAWWHQRHTHALMAAASGRSMPGGLPAGGGDGAGGDASAAMGQGGSQPAALQVPAAALPNLDSQPYLMVSFGNAAYFELAHNWAKSVQAIGAPFLIAGEVDLRCARCCCSPLVPHTPAAPRPLAGAGLLTLPLPALSPCACLPRGLPLPAPLPAPFHAPLPFYLACSV